MTWIFERWSSSRKSLASYSKDGVVDVDVLALTCGAIHEWRLKVRRTITMITTMATTTAKMTSAMAIRLLRWALNANWEWATKFSPMCLTLFEFIWSTEGRSEPKLPVAKDTFSNSSSSWARFSTMSRISSSIDSIFDGLSADMDPSISSGRYESNPLSIGPVTKYWANWRSRWGQVLFSSECIWR